MAFDAELYLRRKGEELLAGSAVDSQPESSSLATAAAALVAVGALSARQAEAVLHGFDQDWAMEFDARRPGWQPASQIVGHISLERIARARVVALGDELLLPEGTLRLRYAVLERDHTALFADFQVRETPTGLNDWIRVPSGMPSGLPRPKLKDESETVRTLEFNAHGNDDRWTGQFFTNTPIAMDALSIELYGTRVELSRSPVSTTVTIEPVQSENRAQLHLLRLLASADPFSSQDPGAASDALLAAGAITLDDPAVAQISAAGTGERQRRRRLAHPEELSGLPAPWPARRAHRLKAPDGLIVIGATTDKLDGHRLAVLALRSRDSGFSVDAEVALADGVRSGLEDQDLVWWARDDLGQSYLGTWDGSSRSTMSGELRFFPPLDPEATRLDLMPSTPTARAVISVPLDWGQPAT